MLAKKQGPTDYGNFGVHGGKHDLERWGIFAEMMYLHGLGMNAVPLYPQTDKGRQMFPGYPKWKTELQDCYFDHEFKRLFIGEALNSVYKRDAKARLEGMTKFRTPAGITPPPGSKLHSTPGDFYGTFGGIVSAFDPRKRKDDGNKDKQEPKNPMTMRPGKKGGIGVADITINQFPDWIVESRQASSLLTSISAHVYEVIRELTHPDLPKTKTYRQLCELLSNQYAPQISVWRSRIAFAQLNQNQVFLFRPEKYDRKMEKKEEAGNRGPFRGGGPGGFFDRNPYLTPNPVVTYKKQKEISWIRFGTFFPPKTSTKIDGMKGGCLSKYPEHSQDKYYNPDQIEKMRGKGDKEKPTGKFIPCGTGKTWPLPSVANLNVDFRTNARNYRTMKPYTYTREFLHDIEF